MNNVSIKWRLRLINLLIAISILAVVGLVHQTIVAEADSDEDYHAVQSALQTQMDEDRVVEELRSDFYAALLTPQLKRDGAAESAAWERDIKHLRAVLADLETVKLPAGVGFEVDANVAVARELVGNLTRISTEFQNHPADTVELVRVVDTQIEEIRSKSAATTAGLVNASETLEARLRSERQRADLLVLVAGLVTVVVTVLIIGLISRSIQRSLNQVANVARDVAAGRLESRYLGTANTEVGELGTCLNTMAENLEKTLTEIRADSDQRSFSNQLQGAFEIADTEVDIFSVVSRAMDIVSADHPMELLLADSSRANLERAAAHSVQGAPGCDVTSPNACMAVRRGSVTTFEDSEMLDACPHLRGRSCGPVSAACIPINFMGRSLGVLHAASSVDNPLQPSQLRMFKAIGMHVGDRIGTVRAFSRSQLQAATDSMTGLDNRRSLEHKLLSVVAAGTEFALIMADLDHFKKLNDTYGHQAGDTALKLFAQVLKGSLRQGDIAARWGGEEFVVVLTTASEHAALEWTDRIRLALAQQCEQYSGPAFTASFGIAHSILSNDLSTLQSIADEALYTSKADGRDRATIGVDPADRKPQRHDTDSNATINLTVLSQEG